MSKTSIEWADETSNPLRLETGGHWCRKISEGCAGCYAEAINGNSYFGFASQLAYSGKPPENLILDREILAKWTRIKKPRSIFVCSMTDWCGDWVPMEWRLESLRAMEKSKANFLLLTKRADELFKTIVAFRNEKFRQGIKDYAPNNIRVGITAENQRTWDERSPYLNAIAAKGWQTMISFEPLLENINIETFDVGSAIDTGFSLAGGVSEDLVLYFATDYLDDCWGIVGGETGKGARQFDISAAENLVQDLQDTGIPIFVKQLGDHPVYPEPDGHLVPWGVGIKNKGKRFETFPEVLQVREFPND